MAQEAASIDMFWAFHCKRRTERTSEVIRSALQLLKLLKQTLHTEETSLQFEDCERKHSDLITL